MKKKKIHIEINFDMIWESGSPETLDYQIEQLLQDQYDLETGSIEINITQDPRNFIKPNDSKENRKYVNEYPRSTNLIQQRLDRDNYKHGWKKDDD